MDREGPGPLDLGPDDGLRLLRGARAGRAAFAELLAVPPFRVSQLLRQVFVRGICDYDAMSDLPLELRSRFAEALGAVGPRVLAERASEDSTKRLVALHDGEAVECVAMRHPWGASACLSTQAGCAVGCVFCASGAEGVARGLSAEEIAGQFLAIRLRHGAVGHALLMGTGEPLLNAEASIEALRTLADRDLFAVPERNLTVSTVGVARGIARLAESGLRVRLAVSLHTADPDLRARLVPRAPDPLDAVVRAARDYEATARRRVTWECVLLAGVNDGESDALALARLLGAGSHVNLIPLNPSPGVTHATPGEGAVRRFENVLCGAGLEATTRRSRGAGAEAACGQLRRARRQGAERD